MSGTHRGRGADATIGGYLINRLQDYGIRHIFGIPGDYVLGFYSMLEESPIEVVGATREDCAGFAADAYARVGGMGALCVTYCVGGLSVCNSVAGAFAEKSPVVVISGAPGLNERRNNPLLHHKVRDFRTQMEVFERLCIAGTELRDPLTAFAEIERVLDACDRYKRPVYIEIPRDMVHVVPPAAQSFLRPREEIDQDALAEAVREAIERLNRAKKPVIIAGVEIHRFGLQDLVLELAEKAEIPIAATILGKSVIQETHPLYVGLYEGALGCDEVTDFVEESDCILLLGTFMTDINLGIYTAELDLRKCIYATSEQLQISHHFYRDIPLDAFLQALIAAEPHPSKRPIPEEIKPRIEPIEVEPARPLQISRMVKMLNSHLHKDNIVIADIGDALFASTELVVHERADFLSPAYYTSMGFSVPAIVGASCAKPDQRVIAICGDGAFQMTGQELSTVIRLGLSPILIILDNGGYVTEKFLHPGDWKYNDIHPWNYYKLPDIYGGGRGYKVQTEGEFAEALEQALEDQSCAQIIHAVMAPGDASHTLRCLAERLGQQVGGHPAS
ncbi:MAG: alpha-keto acid decarboxylase family protein [Planctomycetota bacterium]|nr:MAG: alpha-keto acid decarboxylase family protein [Planctomycetota bacterium]